MRRCVPLVPQPTFVRRALLAMAGACLLAACGGSGDAGGTPPPVSQPSTRIALSRPGVAALKVLADGGRWVAMFERPHGIMDRTVMQRHLELSDADGRAGLTWRSPEGWSLVDFALHPGGEVSTVLSDGTTLRLLRLDSQGRQLAAQTFSDPLVALDPYYGTAGEIRDRSAMAPLKTLDAARVAAANTHLGLALRAGANNVVAYRFDYANGSFVQRWRTLVEPGIGLDGQGLIGGSYDPFGGLDNHWQLRMDMDARGRMAVAVLVSPRAELAGAHAATFDETLPPGFANGVLLTVLDERGVRTRSLAIDNRDKSELHAVKWSGDSVLVAGRVRSARTAAGDGWDGYVARADSTPRLLAYRLVDVDRGDAILDLLPLDAHRVLLAGSTGYTQNPDGESVSETGAPLLARMDTATGALTRIAFPAGPRGNQVRALAPYRTGWLTGAAENVPGTHSADANPALLTLDAWLREIDPGG